jgi:hypothetical protein
VHPASLVCFWWQVGKSLWQFCGEGRFGDVEDKGLEYISLGRSSQGPRQIGIPLETYQ